jgi:hypothetical protein
MVDLLKHAVIIGGLEHWKPLGAELTEDRLAAKVAEIVGVPDVKLRVPPVPQGDKDEAGSGIVGWVFPEWFVAQYDVTDGGHGRRRPLIHRMGLVEGRYLDPDKKKRPVVPVRFVQACINGHISDINWYGFVHGGRDAACRRQLWLEEVGTSGDLSDIFVQCDCGARRPMVHATAQDKQALGFCHGSRPWLGPHAQEKCGGPEGKGQPNRLLIRTATNAYFPQVLRVISIPDRDAQMREAVAAVWDDFLQYAESVEDVTRERRKARVQAALEGYPDDAVYAEVQRRKKGVRAVEKRIKQVELETFLASQDELGEDKPDGDFHAVRRPAEEADPAFAPVIERVVLVHRLREVIAQLGFTRFEADQADVEGELNLEVRRAELAREVSWVPAVENRGEGVFVAFRKDALGAWLARPEVKARGRNLEAGFNAWMAEHPNSKARFPGLPYILLHSLSHLLITAVSLECGYAASSIRERIYAGEAGFGILLYTGTADAEGTLGGLVQVGRRVEAHLRNALELGRLCSNDPVCAQHAPESREEARFLHGAACHGCLLIAETSCERRNEFLDRSLVVGTVDEAGAEFFGDVEP